MKILLTNDDGYEAQNIQKLYEKLSEDNEVVTLLKTTEEKLPGLERWIDVQHEYEVPAIISFQASANVSYETWLNGQLS